MVQATLTDDRFEREGLPARGTRAFAERMDTPVGASTDEETRERILGAPFGATLIIAGRGFTVGRIHDEAIRQVVSVPEVSVVERDDRFALFEDHLAPVSAVRTGENGDGRAPTSAQIPFAAVSVINVDMPLSDRVAESNAPITADTDCPDCGPDATTSFESDSVEVGYRAAVKSLPMDPAEEVRYCHECDDTFVRMRNATPDTGTVERTRGLYGLSEESVEIGGLYALKETCLFPMMRETNAYKGLYTASEVAAFVNKKLQQDDGDPDDLFGFVTVRDGGEEVVWHDDQPYNYECVFKRVDADVIAARGSSDDAGPDRFTLGDEAPDPTLATPDSVEAATSPTASTGDGHQPAVGD